MNSIFVAARQDAARDRRVGLSFWLQPEQERSIRKQYLNEVQQFAGRTLTEDDFAVRGMLVANSQRDFYYSRFSREALDEAAELLPGAPALYGHDTRGVPVGRIFNARVTRIEDPNLDQRDQHWLEALYYVPRDAEGEAHLRRVDLGIFREVSISWRCTGQDCNICGRSIHACPHIPGDIYEDRGFCEYEFSGITAANEVSHVYRGGQKDTSTFVPSDPGADGAVTPAAGALMRACPPGSLDIDPAMLIAAKRANGEWFRSNGTGTLDEWLASERGQRATGFLGLSFGQAGLRANVQRIEVQQGRFTGPAQAKRWARDHDFRVDRMKVTALGLAFEQQNMRHFESDGWREVALDRGVTAVVGTRPGDGARQSPERNNDADPLSRWMTSAAMGATS
jgi:hypothetical protein